MSTKAVIHGYNVLMQGRARILLATRVRMLRAQRGWSQERLAEVSGLHRNYIGHIERAELNIGLDNLERLAQAFNVSVVEMLIDGVMERDDRH